MRTGLQHALKNSLADAPRVAGEGALYAVSSGRDRPVIQSVAAREKIEGGDDAVAGNTPVEAAPAPL